MHFQGLPGEGVGLTPALRRLYGSELVLAAPLLYANFVSSIDGVVGLEDRPSSGTAISGKSDADRFLMGLLRSVADAVLVGAGTLRATPGHRWTAQHVYPPLAPEYARLRTRLRRAEEPRLVVVTSSGDLDPSHPALQAGALVLTTEAGARHAAAILPPTCEVRSISRSTSVDLATAVEMLHSEGHGTILSEAGPMVMGQLVRQGLVDDLFLTVSPVLAGRIRGDDVMGMIEGLHLLPGHPAWMRLVDIRRQRSHLFLRYQPG